MIRLLVPKMPTRDDLLPYLKEIDESQWYSNFGPLERSLCARLSDRYGAHVVTVGSCTAGLELMYWYWKKCGHDTIELPSLTFPATILAARRAGLRVKFADVDPETWTHPAVAGFGVASDGTWVDAAAAFGDQKVRRHQTAVFSLHATKTVGAGEGGFIVTHNAQLAERWQRQTNFGFRDGISQYWGTNAKLSEYHAAVAHASLDAWDPEPWLRLDGWYRRYLPLFVKQQKRPPGVYPILAVLLPQEVSVEGVSQRLCTRGIETRRWYWPSMHQHPTCGDPEARLPITEEISDRLLGLPYHLFLTEDDVKRVCATLSEEIL